ncbi:MAG: ATP-binding protein [Tepidisphaerales bacterium]
MRKQTREIRQRLLEHIFWGIQGPAVEVAQEYDLSRQGAHLHLGALERDGLVDGKGQTRLRRYSLSELERAGQKYKLDGSLSAEQIWERVLKGPTLGCGPQAHELLHYAAVAAIANAIDHSGGTRVAIELLRTAVSVRISIEDDGVGVFKKIADAARLHGPYEAAVKLADTRFTTDPGRHKGEALHFAARACDRYEICSGQVRIARSSLDQRMRIETVRDPVQGTRVVLELILPAKRTLKEVLRLRGGKA